MDLVVPVKTLSRAKSRLRGAVDDDANGLRAHRQLSLALARDTITAARSARHVRRLVAVTSDPAVTSALTADGVEVLADHPERGLNAALEFAADVVGGRAHAGVLGALQADLPALRPDELEAALSQALAVFGAGTVAHAFCPDAQGEGTTLLLCAPSVRLVPRFGPRSAQAHERIGGYRLTGAWPGLRRDVDTPADLRRAAELGMGPATVEALRAAERHLKFTQNPICPPLA